jgi:hypothetical protein
MERKCMTKPTHYDDAVVVGANTTIRMSADSLRALKKATGLNLSELLTDEDETNRFQVMAFAELHRRYTRSGHMPDAGELWERAGAVELEFAGESPAVDPTGGESLTVSPASADIGA